MNDNRTKHPLRISRYARGMSQVELAARSGVGLTTLRRLEAGDPIAKAVATKLARTLGATLEERLGWREHSVACQAERLVTEPRPCLAAVLAARAAAAAKCDPQASVDSGDPARDDAQPAEPEQAQP